MEIVRPSPAKGVDFMLISSVLLLERRFLHSYARQGLRGYSMRPQARQSSFDSCLQLRKGQLTHSSDLLLPAQHAMAQVFEVTPRTFVGLPGLATDTLTV